LALRIKNPSGENPGRLASLKKIPLFCGLSLSNPIEKITLPSSSSVKGLLIIITLCNTGLLHCLTIKYHKMKTKVLLLILLVAAGLTMTSCYSSRSARSGCKTSAGFVGYGH
jgi:hypothetical protein